MDEIITVQFRARSPVQNTLAELEEQVRTEVGSVFLAELDKHMDRLFVQGDAVQRPVGLLSELDFLPMADKEALIAWMRKPTP